MIETYFTSDLHIGHEKVARIRHDEGMDPEIDIDAFMATGQHEEILAANWDALVNPLDIVWVLGDISSGGSVGQRVALDWIQARHGRKHLILGNHDGPHPMYRDSHRWMPRYLEVFDSVQLAARRRIPLAEGHVNALLSHFPYSGDHSVPDRHPQWRLPDLGDYIIHGHVHSQQRVSWGGRLLGQHAITVGGRRVQPNQIHVGLDAWDYRPASLKAIHQLVNDIEETP